MSNKPSAIVFGAGNGYKYHFNYINDYFEVIAIVDNDERKHGISIDDVIVESPENIQNYEYDVILITPPYNFAVEIRMQLEKMGVPKSKLRFQDFNGIKPFAINPLFFAHDLCYSQKKELFSQNMERVIIELNSKCNRKCWFCTNSLFDNSCPNIDMSDDVFNKIINELTEINYNQDICLSFFNEPFLCTKLCERIKNIKEALPDSYVYLFTNGDYLTKESIDLLEKSGLDLLYIDIYINKIDYCIDEAYEIAKKIINNNDLSINLYKYVDVIHGYGKSGTMNIEIVSQNFSKGASNRAESLPESLPIPKITSHPLPCIKNFISYHIDFRGDVWPCPNFHRDFEKHRQYCVGNVINESIYDIYIGDKMTKYRERNFFYRDELPCRSCIWNFNTLISNKFHLEFRDRPFEK